MIKFIGIGIISLGLLILLYTIIYAKKNEIKRAARELKLITESGYAKTHVSKEKSHKNLLEEEMPVPVASRKRELSQDAKALLEKVEKDRAKGKTEPSVKLSSKEIKQKTEVLDGEDFDTYLPKHSRTKTAVLEEIEEISFIAKTEPLLEIGQSVHQKTEALSYENENTLSRTEVLSSATEPTEKTGVLELGGEAGTEVLADLAIEKTDVL